MPGLESPLVIRFLLPLFMILGHLSLLGASQVIPAAHLTIHRRGGALAHRAPANLTQLVDLLHDVERRYSRVKREVKGNKLVRSWRARSTGATNDEQLLAEPGKEGSWYTNLPVGPPPNTIEVDLDMLSPDFYTVQTTSGKGSQYNVFSETHVPNDARVHPLCKHPSDTIHLTDLKNTTSVTISLPMCSPSRSSRATLFKSGSVLGLSPSPSSSSSLARLDSPPLLQQLLSAELLTDDIFSLTLLDSTSGILSLGGTLARQAEEASTRTQVEIDSIGDPAATTETISAKVNDRLAATFPADMEDQYRWAPIRGAAKGWWTTLLPGLWINGFKILKNQPVLLDIQSPFILAPPLAARRIYESIGGCSRLAVPYDMFWKFPCLNRPKIMLEFGGWFFPLMSSQGGHDEAIWGPEGGRMSLGKLSMGGNGTGSGYCVGRVVETRMGLQSREDIDWEGSGLRDVWVLGEPAFWGVGVVFDGQRQRVGFRNY
ncbi:hypothetical protein GJ744_003487 [Endocarpon pusillum]|uniref:Peptidase A1 domain-containing protein n=1 Tax=Endocarpon pusillum TaxID=364733 RepID=A0A8H7ARB1_9EURO|nr:hypothetical protein GJ744_003487 [Endocarpon pusillum]